MCFSESNREILLIYLEWMVHQLMVSQKRIYQNGRFFMTDIWQIYRGYKSANPEADNHTILVMYKLNCQWICIWVCLRVYHIDIYFILVNIRHWPMENNQMVYLDAIQIMMCNSLILKKYFDIFGICNGNLVVHNVCSGHYWCLSLVCVCVLSRCAICSN